MKEDCFMLFRRPKIMFFGRTFWVVIILKINTRKLCVAAMFAAISYVLAFLIRISIVPGLSFLGYGPANVMIASGGFILGPLWAFGISVIEAIAENLTFSDTGIVGCIMNILSGCAFACTAALIYKKWHTLPGVITGLICGTLLSTGVMLLWNYLITPMYMGVRREDIAALLIPAFLPFNLIKGTLNSALTLMFYKPLTRALRATHLLVAVSSSGGTSHRNRSIGVWIVSLAVIATCVLIVLAMRGVI